VRQMQLFPPKNGSSQSHRLSFSLVGFRVDKLSSQRKTRNKQRPTPRCHRCRCVKCNSLHQKNGSSQSCRLSFSLVGFRINKLSSQRKTRNKQRPTPRCHWRRYIECNSLHTQNGSLQSHRLLFSLSLVSLLIDKLRREGKPTVPLLEETAKPKKRISKTQGRPGHSCIQSVIDNQMTKQRRANTNGLKVDGMLMVHWVHARLPKKY